MNGVPVNANTLFKFESFEDWVNKAQSLYAPYQGKKTIAVDTDGNLCSIGLHFMNAKDKNLFPITVYLLKTFKD